MGKKKFHMMSLGGVSGGALEAAERKKRREECLGFRTDEMKNHQGRKKVHHGKKKKDVGPSITFVKNGVGIVLLCGYRLETIRRSWGGTPAEEI